MKIVLLVITSIILAGCAGMQLQQQRNMLAAQGQPPEYIDGYSAGCNSGTSAAGNPYFSFEKDVRRFQNDSLYSQGWNDGFQICKSKYDSIMNSMRR